MSCLLPNLVVMLPVCVKHHSNKYNLLYYLTFFRLFTFFTFCFLFYFINIHQTSIYFYVFPQHQLNPLNLTAPSDASTPNKDRLHKKRPLKGYPGHFSALSRSKVTRIADPPTVTSCFIRFC